MCGVVPRKGENKRSCWGAESCCLSPYTLHNSSSSNSEEEEEEEEAVAPHSSPVPFSQVVVVLPLLLLPSSSSSFILHAQIHKSVHRFRVWGGEKMKRDTLANYLYK